MYVKGELIMKDYDTRIGNYTWRIKFVSKEELNGCDGRTIPNDFNILIRNDLPKLSQKLVFIHEIVHALLDTQGRCYQKSFNVEDMCEFFAFRFEELKSIVEMFEKENEE